MTLEMGLWRAEGGKLTRLSASGIALEKDLEDFIEADPMLLGERLLIVGRQVPTTHGGFIDLLAVDIDGAVHVLELKRDKTPRDVVAQTLDYGSWVAELGRNDIVDIFGRHRVGEAFDEAFAQFFGVDSVPDEINGSQVFTIVAASVDSATERIVRFLNEIFDVPVNVVFFRHFRDQGSSYLARTWLVTQEVEAAPRQALKSRQTREPWNGQDWYVSFGEESGLRVWEDARKYGFVSAGGGECYSRSLRNLPVGARVFVCVPKSGYVGVGRVVGPVARFEDATVEVGGQQMLLAELPLSAKYVHNPQGDTDESAEYVVPVQWEATVPASQAIWKRGLFANQNSACKLSRQFTIETVATALEVPVEA